MNVPSSVDGTRRLFHAYFKTVAESRVPSTPGRFLEFQEATFRFAVLTECTVVRGTQLLVLSTSDLQHQISDPGTQFKTSRVAEIPNGDLQWTVVVAKTMGQGVGDRC